jgi:hypothetical protein
VPGGLLVSDVSGRVVEVFAPTGSGRRGRVGAGFLLGGGLVLSAGHVIEDAAGACQVRGLGSAGWTDAAVAGDRDGDCALLRVAGAVGDVEWARLGRLVGDDRVACEATGFPWAQTKPRDGAAVHATERLVGEVDRLSGREPGVGSWLLTIHVTGSVPESREGGGSPWAGMSGAGLVCGELLVGVVIVDPARFGADRLLALPLTGLLGVPGFAEALAKARGESAVLEAVEVQGVLERPYEPPPPQRARQSSSFLLGARYRVVPFRPVHAASLTRCASGHTPATTSTLPC